MYTVFAGKILVLRTNQTKMAAGRSVAKVMAIKAEYFFRRYHQLIIVIILLKGSY